MMICRPSVVPAAVLPGPDDRLKAHFPQEDRVAGADEHDFALEAGNTIDPCTTGRSQVADGEHIGTATQSGMLAMYIRTVDADIGPGAPDDDIDGGAIDIA